MESKTKKKSLIRSSLISTGGFFIAKLLGLVYTIPLASILASDAYLSYYGTAYRIYSYILQVFTAGFPMAVATMIATYATLEDPRTVLKVRRIAIRFLAVMGAAGMLLMMLLSPLFGSVVAGQENGSVMRNVLLILSAAVFLVPLLSAYRGYCQGMDEMEEYAFSQTFEQFVRVGFLLGVSCLLVYGFHADRVWALYASVAATSVAALAGLFQIARYTGRSRHRLEKAAAGTDAPDIPARKLVRDFVLLAVPYFVMAILGYIDDPINSILLPYALNHSGYTPDQVNVVLSAVNYVGSKLISIPMILGPGFTAALIPHITSMLAEQNLRGVRKNVREVISIVLYVALPVCACMALYARPIYYILYYTEDLNLAASTIAWNSLEGVAGSVLPVITSMMMALRLRRAGLKSLAIYSVFKVVTVVPMVMWLGFPGAVLSSLTGALYVFFANLHEIRHRYRIRFRALSHQMIFIVGGLLCMWGVTWLIQTAGFTADSGSKLVCLLQLMVSGLVSLGVYLGVTWFFQIPQTVFGLRGRSHV